MADLTITAADVLKGANATVEQGTAGATVAAGKVVYKDTADGEWKLAGSNDTALVAGSNGFGIALHASEDGQPLSVQTGGGLDLGAALSVGRMYVVSANNGMIAPSADLATNNYVTYVGHATAADNLDMYIGYTGTQYA